MKKSRNKTGIIVGVILTLAALVLTAGGVWYQLNPPASLEASSIASPQVDLPETVKAPQKPSDAPMEPETSEASPDTPEPSEPTTDPVDVLSVPELGVTVPLGALAVKDNQITPPTFDKAYVVADYSVPLAEANTGGVLVVFHSTRWGTGIGNKFFNQQSGESTLTAGDHITVGGNTYKVTAVYAEGKKTLNTRTSIWEPSPGQLHLVTCLQTPDRSDSTSNFIIEAELV